MIPKTNDVRVEVKQPADLPTRTYRLDTENKTVCGHCDGLAAMRQAAYKILSTERYENLIYSPDYGAELAALFGQQAPFVYPDIERVITEALMQDARITAVDGFVFERKKGAVACTCQVHTTQGEFTLERDVKI